MTRAAADPHVAEVLASPSVAVLATVGPDDVAHGAPVWFLHEPDGGDDGASGTGLGVVWVSTRADTQKHRNVERRPGVSLTVVDPADPFRYVEVRGRATVVSDDDYARRDAVVRKHGHADGSAFDPPGARRVALRIEIDRVLGR